MGREKSPFPGWDPYVQRYWRDVHHRLITYSSDFLRRQLPSDLRARIEERVVLEAEERPGETQTYVPDIAVIEWAGEAGRAGGSVDQAVAEPIEISTLAEPLTEGYIEIRDLSNGGRLVTTIEFTSPSNKAPGKGADAFRRKQRESLRAKVSLVEIDLIRGGEHVITATLEKIPPDYHDPPFICVTEAWRPAHSLFYPISIKKPLPAIRIPLRPSDKQARLDVQAVFDQAYLNGEYGADIDYNQGIKLPLYVTEAEWIQQHLRSEGFHP
jgi:hypothetical protein